MFKVVHFFVDRQRPLEERPRASEVALRQLRRWVLAAERPVVADIHPRPTASILKVENLTIVKASRPVGI
jgi:hypothetical protein